jgi:sugar-specific transcriptional regulator TrmB
MVYDVLSRLTQKGIVLESSDERSKFYRPLPPEILLDTHLTTVRSLITEVKPRLLEIYQSEDNHRFWSLTDISAIFAYAGELLSSIEHHAMLMLNDSHIDALDIPLAALSESQAEFQFLLTGDKTLPFPNITHHPPLESELQEITDTILIIVDDREVLLAETGPAPSATITNNPGFIMISRQFLWMEIFTQRIVTQLGDEFISRLEPADQEIILSQIHRDNRKIQ